MIRVIESLEGLYLTEKEGVYTISYKDKKGKWDSNIIVNRHMVDRLIEISDNKKNEK
jgi:hypothetical protein